MARQSRMFENDPLDPALAKAADKYVELLKENAKLEEQIKLEAGTLLGLMINQSKPRIRHGGMIIEIQHTNPVDKLKTRKAKEPNKSRR